jgi:hypothetical protein
MPLVLVPKERVDVERLALASVQRADALVDLHAEPPQLLDVRQQPLANLFLIGGRQIGNFSDRDFERFHHVEIIARGQAPSKASGFNDSSDVAT